MHRLSKLIGRPVTLGGRTVGVVVDVVVAFRGEALRDQHDATGPGTSSDRLDRFHGLDRPDGHPSLTTLLVGHRRAVRAAVPWHDVATVGATVALRAEASVHLDPAEGDPPAVATGAQELRLGRDVLDTQVFDIGGRRLARVADVLIEGLDEGPGRAHVAAVDVGMGAVCARLGLRRLGRRLGDEIIDWSALHLASSPGHRLALEVPHSAVHRLDAADVGHLIAAVGSGPAADILTTIDPQIAADAVAEAAPAVAERVVRALSDDAVDAVLAGVAPERAHRLRRARRPGRPPRRYLRHRSWRRRPRPPRAEPVRGGAMPDGSSANAGDGADGDGASPP